MRLWRWLREDQPRMVSAGVLVWLVGMLAVMLGVTVWLWSTR